MNDVKTELPKKRTTRAKSSDGGGIVEALLRARREISGYKKTGKNAHRANSYGTLQDMLSAIHPALYENDLIEEFSYALVEGAWHCFLTVIHAPTKESRQIFKPMIIETGGRINGEQAWASSSTYSRRYLLESFFGLCEGDDGDDGGRSGMNSKERAQYTADMDELARLRAERTGGIKKIKQLEAVNIDLKKQLDEMSTRRTGNGYDGSTPSEGWLTKPSN